MKTAGFSPSVRLFEAAACATPIISDEWDGIDTILKPGEEIIIVKGSEDIVSILSNQDENTRKMIGEKARIKILSQHTGEHRSLELEDYIIMTKNKHRRKVLFH